MSVEAVQFSYRVMEPGRGEADSLPFMPLTLALGSRSVSAVGLVDNGATVNVLPYEIGVRLGAQWDHQNLSVALTGSLAHEEARGLVVTAIVANFPPVKLAFAWARSNSVPLLLGQGNFFMEFNVCFFRSKSVFVVQPK